MKVHVHPSRGFALALALLLVVANGLPALAQDPLRAEYERLSRQAAKAYEEQRWEEAVAAYEKCLALDESDNTSAYNIACCWSLKGDKAKALQWLQKSFDLGFTDGQHTEKDKDFDNIRGEPGYQELVEKMKAQAAANEVRDYALHVPASYDGSAPVPLLIALHGSQGVETSMIARWRALADAKTVIVLAVRGTVRVRDNSYRWDEHAEQTVMAILNEVRAKVRVDPARIWLTGDGQGAYQAYRIAMHSPDLFHAVASFSGLYPPELEYNFPEAKKHRLGVCLVHGEQDVEKLPAARAAAQKMTEAGVACELVEHKGGADVSAEDWPALSARVWEWLEKQR